MPEPAPHRLAVRVYFEDTDSGGVVYHATHLRWAERARTEWLRDQGLAHRDMIEGMGLVFVVRRAVIDYIRPAVLDEPLWIETRVLRLGGASVVLGQRVLRVSRNGEEDVALLEVTLVCVRRDLGGVVRIPAAIRALVARGAGVLGAGERGAQLRTAEAAGGVAREGVGRAGGDRADMVGRADGLAVTTAGPDGPKRSEAGPVEPRLVPARAARAGGEKELG